MSLESDRPRRIVDDPVVIRAMAHPLRLKLHALVGREGSVTAAQAARELGISQALASHHLRQLAKYGFIERAEAGDERERPWRVTSTSYSWEPAVNDPEGASAADVLERLLAERAVAQLLDWQRRREDWPAPWRQNTGIGQNLVYLTIEEAVELRERLDALITPLVRRRPIGQPEARPADAVPLDLTLLLVPVPSTPSGG
jgi:predicted ArsR family transcriptional regulator